MSGHFNVVDGTDPPQTKTCSECQEELILDEFGDHPHGYLGKRSQCHKCRAKRERTNRTKRKKPDSNDDWINRIFIEAAKEILLQEKP